jgi:2-isopropylmalate synthase
LLEAETEYVAVFGKTWTFQVSEILHATKAENLEMIRDSVAYLVGKGRKVFFDAEHFFDGYQADPAYAMECLRVAREAGVEALVLCETRGGMLPDVVGRVTKAVTETFSCPIGIHAHDDSGCAVANSLAAVDAGAVQVQGTLLGYGERCGNACLSTIMADLVLKKGMECTGGERLTRLTPVCRKVAEISNVAIPHSMPYVGASAFAHKGGMHIDGVKKNPLAYEHVEPSSVGNERRLLMSEVAGRALMLDRIRTVLPGSKKDDPQIIALMDLLKRLEADGYQFEGAESSFDLVIRRHLAAYHPFFSLVHYQTIGSLPYADPNSGYSHDAVGEGAGGKHSRDHCGGRGRSGERVGQGAPESLGAVLSDAEDRPPDGLQGKGALRFRGDRFESQGFDRVDGRQGELVDHWRKQRHHRGELARFGGQH